MFRACGKVGVSRNVLQLNATAKPLCAADPRMLRRWPLDLMTKRRRARAKEKFQVYLLRFISKRKFCWTTLSNFINYGKNVFNITKIHLLQPWEIVYRINTA